jgi:hypothetical protein
MAGSASAQFLGQMSPASILDYGTGRVGAYYIGAENADAVIGSVRYGLSSVTEGRFRFGFIDQDGRNTDPHVILGLDGKYLLWDYKGSSSTTGDAGSSGYKNPFDLSLGGGIEYAKLNNSSIMGLGLSVIGSMPFRFSNNSVIEPYARFNIRYQRLDIDDFYDPLGNKIEGGDDSDFEIGLNIGALFSVTQLVDFTAEFQLDDENAFMLGIDIAAF